MNVSPISDLVAHLHPDVCLLAIPHVGVTDLALAASYVDVSVVSVAPAQAVHLLRSTPRSRRCRFYGKTSFPAICQRRCPPSRCNSRSPPCPFRPCVYRWDQLLLQFLLSSMYPTAVGRLSSRRRSQGAVRSVSCTKMARVAFLAKDMYTVLKRKDMRRSVLAM